MIKRILSTLLASLIIFSSVSVFAAKKPEEAAAINIYELWGGFEEEISVKPVSLNVGSSASKVSFQEGGARGSKGCLRYDGILKNYLDDTTLPFPGVPGETYAFSFDFKAETPGCTGFKYIIDRETGTNEGKVAFTESKKWQKVEFEITLPTNNGAGKAGGNAKRIRFNFEGEYPNVVYIDNLVCTPAGNVPDADYSSVNEKLIVETPEEVNVIKKDDVNFSDVTGHWAERTIESLAKYGYINGMGDGTYAPNDYVTRAQFIKMVSDVYGIRYPEYDGRFEDVKGDEWYAGVLRFADQMGNIDDALKLGGNISPEQPITREEAATIAAKVATDRGAAAKEGAKTSFKDNASISDWAREGVKTAASLGMIAGYEDGTYKPGKNITRAEAAKILFRIVEISSRISIFVDAETGSDENDGTETAPLKSVYAARDLAAKFKDTMENDITIYVRGEQYLDKTFELTDKNSGGNGYTITYTSWGDEKATFTMAKKYTGFTLHDADKDIWKVYVGRGADSRQAYFNDVRGVRAKTVGYLTNCDFVDMSYYLCDDFYLLDLKKPQEVEGKWHLLWNDSRHLVKSITEQDGRVRIDFSDYFTTNMGRIYHDGNKNIRRQTPSFLENAYEFLDECGEWYLDKDEGYVYYKPMAHEDMSTMELKLPVGEYMINGKGSEFSKPLENVTFDNIIFEGATWLEINKIGGHSPLQNNKYAGPQADAGLKYGAFGQTTGAVVHFEECKNLTLSNNVFRHMGNNGLQIFRGSRYVNIIGNEFYDISASSMIIDDLRAGHQPHTRNKEDYVQYINIRNNYIHNVSVEYESSAAVTLAYPRHSNFTHNEVAYTQYSGLHICWGWSLYISTGTVLYDLEIANNYIHDIMVGRVSDGSAIYSVGHSSHECDMTPEAPNNGANKNRIINNYLVNGWQCDLVYPDEQSTSWYIANNVADVGPYKVETEFNFDRNPRQPGQYYWLHMWKNTIKWMTVVNNFSTHDYAYAVGHMNQTESIVEPVNMYPDRNWPDEARAIINNAGIEPEYRDNFKLHGPKIFVSNNRWQDLEVGKKFDAGFHILGDDNVKYPVQDFDIDFWCSEPGAVTLDKDGYLTAHKEGIFEADAYIILDGVRMWQHFMLECYDGISSIQLSQDAVNLLAGNSVNLDVLAYTSLGDAVDIKAAEGLDVNIKMEDESIATLTFDETLKKYTVQGINRGKTAISGQISYDGKTYEINVPVKIITYGNDEAAKLPFVEYDFVKSWENNPGGAKNGGMFVSSANAHFMELIENKLVAFDMEINPGNSWPSIAICDSDKMGDYSTNDCYMFGFKSGIIELQRWNGGTRTMIFGDTKYNPIGGPGLPNVAETEGGEKVFEYNKRYSVVMGALDTEEGTRVVLTLNGKNIIDFVDNTSGKLKASGYFVSYNPAPGGTTFYHYTGITE